MHEHTPGSFEILCPLCEVLPETQARDIPIYLQPRKVGEWRESNLISRGSQPQQSRHDNTYPSTLSSTLPSTFHEADNFFSQIPESAWTMSFRIEKLSPLLVRASAPNPGQPLATAVRAAHHSATCIEPTNIVNYPLMGDGFCLKECHSHLEADFFSFFFLQRVFVVFICLIRVILSTGCLDLFFFFFLYLLYYSNFLPFSQTSCAL